MPSTSSVGWRILVVAALLALVTACAPGTPDADSWRGDAERAVSNAASALSSAEVALRLHGRDRMFGTYLQTVLVDAEDGVGTAGDAIGAEQPPASERDQYDAVTAQLAKASDLVSAARIAVVDRDTGRYADLADRLADAAAALRALGDRL